MKPVLSLFLLILLASCSFGGSKWPKISLSARMESASDWTRRLPDFYPAMMNCLNRHPSQPAYVGEVVPLEDDMISVRIVGANDQRLECIIEEDGNKPESVQRLAEPDLYGPFFTPVWMPEPSFDCTETVPVNSTKGQLLGWITYTGCGSG